MKYTITNTLTLVTAITLSGCCSTPKLAELDMATTDFCSKFNKSNEKVKASGIDNDMGNRAMTRRSVGNFHGFSPLAEAAIVR
ncbi:hypothetical protein STH12_02448 [Shewanella khirikhana]|uniref:Lipoprotein n=1 Tax=Shewanella khirikhana TaxID=1965282 RepID=A0ABM7DPD0_9GAMM|nr:hypothetical protein STH12_02448 [Shewanella khirikhana]